MTNIQTVAVVATIASISETIAISLVVWSLFRDKRTSDKACSEIERERKAIESELLARSLAKSADVRTKDDSIDQNSGGGV